VPKQKGSFRRSCRGRRRSHRAAKTATKKRRARLPCRAWKEGRTPNFSSKEIWEDCGSRAPTRTAVVAKSPATIAKGLATGGDRVELPTNCRFFAQCDAGALNAQSLKPMAARFGPGTKFIAPGQSEAAKAMAALPVEDVTVTPVNNHLIGGGLAAGSSPTWWSRPRRIAKRSLTGECEGSYGPARRTSSTTSIDGLSRRDFRQPVGRASIVRMEIRRSPFRRSLRLLRLPSRRASTSTPSMPPSTCLRHSPNLVEYLRRAEGRADGCWRGVGPNNTVFAIECV